MKKLLYSTFACLAFLAPGISQDSLPIASPWQFNFSIESYKPVFKHHNLNPAQDYFLFWEDNQGNSVIFEESFTGSKGQVTDHHDLVARLSGRYRISRHFSLVGQFRQHVKFYDGLGASYGHSLKGNLDAYRGSTDRRQVWVWEFCWTCCHKILTVTCPWA